MLDKAFHAGHMDTLPLRCPACLLLQLSQSTLADPHPVVQHPWRLTLKIRKTQERHYLWLTVPVLLCRVPHLTLPSRSLLPLATHPQLPSPSASSPHPLLSTSSQLPQVPHKESNVRLGEWVLTTEAGTLMCPLPKDVRKCIN